MSEHEDLIKSQTEAGYVGYWSINYSPDDPAQLCLWKTHKPNLFHRVMNRFLLGNRWFDNN